ncbi:hypothetical protein EYE40_01740 [Glaciihabitans arcticus]|uniref:Ribosomally synthesized peptide with SipW-like signal peptide n=1 Tax=Glaciihabitans arcticus TaxID=2668039 RepID=A0A4Q9GSZ7_9MICO|nr:SipW-dependent-type signal peptide-containing protein [Glaciihabitans arcticus]TBN56217.1 hypothetical protein EYE40_01740 [Glaciihabitans arcticus]
MQNSVPAGLATAPSKTSAIRALFATAGTLAAGVLVAVLAAGGTYALWNDSVPVQAATVQTGTSGITVNGAETFSVDLSATTLLPGRSVVPATPIVLKNIGVTPLSVTAPSIIFTAESSALQPYLQVSMIQATGTTCTVTADGTPLPAAIAPIAFTVGQTTPVCLEIRLAPDAPASVQGSSATFLISLNAAQVRP